VKRILLLSIALILVVWAHGATPAVQLAGTSASHRVSLGNSGSSFIPTVGQQVPSGTPSQTENEPTKGGAGLGQALLDMSEPASLLLLGTALLCIVCVRRRLPTYLRQRQIKIKAAWQVVSGFFF
jgi:hypothetical protein